MGLLLFALVPMAVYVAAFILYGGRLGRAFGLSADRATPAVLLDDGNDYVPTRPAILLGQHFAAIAAVGPIAGPILAGQQYGWLPGMLWIILGAVFIGAVHDFSALAASVRHGARTIGEVFREHLGGTASLAFSLFLWLSLLYVIVVFADLTSSAFVSRPALGGENFGPGVATSSLLYLAVACLMGVALYKGKAPLWKATSIFVPMVFAVIWLGQKLPLAFPGEALQQQRIWNVLILGYCALASVLPMWILLQPRGYLGGFILYTTFAAGVGGLLFGGLRVEQPAWAAGVGAGAGLPIFPILFTTIACGACSGFHGLVASGTTSKQLRSEPDAVTVGYGGMLLESLVGVIALATVVIAAPGSPQLALGPDEIYARGLAHFMQVFGIPFTAGVIFAKLAFATFIYDTLDVATRLGRYVIQELTGWKGRWGSWAATAATLAVPLGAVFMTFQDPSGKSVPLWKVFWPAFGASNQLLAALTLTGITVWLKKEGRPWLITALPAAFMSLVTLSSLVVITKPWLKSLAAGKLALHPIGTTGLVLLLLAASFYVQAARAFFALPSTRR